MILQVPGSNYCTTQRMCCSTCVRMYLKWAWPILFKVSYPDEGFGHGNISEMPMSRKNAWRTGICWKMDTVLSTCAPRYRGFVVLLIHTIVRPSREKLSLALEFRPCAYRTPLTLPPSLWGRYDILCAKFSAGTPSSPPLNLSTSPPLTTPHHPLLFLICYPPSFPPLHLTQHLTTPFYS